MSKVRLVFVLLIAVASAFYTLFGQTNVGGPVNTNTTWSLAGSPYIVTSDVTIPSGITLSIQPGVTVKFSLGTELVVSGTLTAQGTSVDSVWFTSNSAIPAPGDWQRIRFHGPNSNSSILRRCAILYGGSGSTGNVYCENYFGEANPTIENCRIALSSNYGIYVANSSPVISKDELTENQTGIYCISSNPSIDSNSISGNGHYGVQNVTSTDTVDARYNWWGYATGPYHPTLNPSGKGDTVSNYVKFIPWLPNPPIIPPTNIGDRQVAMPISCNLMQNYPNPFNPSTTIRYGLAGQSHVTLAVFNTLGQQVAILENGEKEAGYHEANFDGSNLSSGVYFYRLIAGDYFESRKMIVLR
jgi:hypothetical protein